MEKKGFSLIELLVVIAIVGILAALILPALAGMQERGKRGKTASNLRQVGAALVCYASDNGGSFPAPHGSVPYSLSPNPADPATPVAWQQLLDPYIDFSGTSTSTIGSRAVFNAPTGVSYRTNSFFFGSFAASYEVNHDNTSVNPAALSLKKITRPSMHILGGEVGSTTQFAQDDADKDDYAQNNPAFSGNNTNRLVQILFADGHIGAFKQFDPTVMTVRYEGTKTNGEGYSYSDP